MITNFFFCKIVAISVNKQFYGKIKEYAANKGHFLFHIFDKSNFLFSISTIRSTQHFYHSELLIYGLRWIIALCAQIIRWLTLKWLTILFWLALPLSIFPFLPSSIVQSNRARHQKSNQPPINLCAAWRTAQMWSACIVLRHPNHNEKQIGLLANWIHWLEIHWIDDFEYLIQCLGCLPRNTR